MTRSGQKILRPLVILSIAQLIGWGTVSFLAVISHEIGADLGLDISTIFAGTTVFYIAMGTCAPFLSGTFRRFGARQVMICGTVIAACGLGLLSSCHSPITYFLAWLILGVAGSATLTTPAHILLNEIAGRDAGRAIATLMLVTGLYGTVFWPLTSILTAQLGWRGTCVTYAAVLLVICLPLYIFGLPRSSKIDRVNPAPDSQLVRPNDRTFVLIVTAIALNAFVTFGFSAILIELLKAEGLSASNAIAFGSALGILQISARGLNIVVGKRWDGLTMGIASSAILFLSLIVLLVAHGSILAIVAFLALYGLGSGALAVARSTIPLVFYDKSDFAKALSRIALPLNWISAISPPLLISLMTNFGSSAVLIVSAACSCASIVALAFLANQRPFREAIPTP
ncbi:MFS transporter [Phyllobacterium sp. 22552]|uniref:MFS transporter n=1 Tax=Phyllobacterium sp. 22552 TaxID=3453941 RepID=UPI003F836BD2